MTIFFASKSVHWLLPVSNLLIIVIKFFIFHHDNYVSDETKRAYKLDEEEITMKIYIEISNENKIRGTPSHKISLGIHKHYWFINVHFTSMRKRPILESFAFFFLDSETIYIYFYWSVIVKKASFPFYPSRLAYPEHGWKLASGSKNFFFNDS